MQDGRDHAGRFAPGNGLAKGRAAPWARRSLELRKAALDSVGEDELRGVFRKLVELALGGDLGAIRELLDRVLGKAPLAPEDRPDAEELARRMAETLAAMRVSDALDEPGAL